MENLLDIGGIVIGLFAIVGVIVGIATYRKEHPKRELVWHSKTTPLISHSTDRLNVTLDDQPLREPQVTTVTLSSKSRAAIPSDTFDAGKPIYFKVGARGDICLLLENSGDIKIKSADIGEIGTPGLYVHPQLIRTNSYAEFTFVTNGPPKVEVEDSMIDVPVRMARDDELRPITRKFIFQQILFFGLAIFSIFMLLRFAEHLVVIFV